MKNLTLTPLFSLLVACGSGGTPNTPPTTFYSSYELDQVVNFAVECVNTTKPVKQQFASTLGTIQDKQIWGTYNFKTKVLNIHKELDYTKYITKDDQYKYKMYLVYVTSHEIRHHAQNELGWTPSVPSMLWEDRPEEQDAEQYAAICLAKYLDDLTKKDASK